jgi:hypothetical protein
MNKRLDPLRYHGYTLTQKENYVLVMFPDGRIHRVINARLSPDTIQSILDAAGKPANFRKALPSSVVNA